MGYLSNSSVTVDMILTKKGRSLLSMGESFFKITQFALADDEIDYGNWNPNHPLGSNYYGEIIDNMPILEAISDETQVMKYKLVSYPKSINKLPVFSSNVASQTLQYGSPGIIIQPQVNNPGTGDANSTFGYTFTVSDKRVLALEAAPGMQIAAAGVPTSAPSTQFSDESVSHTVIAKAARIVPQLVSYDTYVTVQIYGNETGGFSTLTFLVKAPTVGQVTA